MQVPSISMKQGERKMSHSIQLRRLNLLAEQTKHSFIFSDLAEISFITTARFRGFDKDLIDEVAVFYWPTGHTSHKIQALKKAG